MLFIPSAFDRQFPARGCLVGGTGRAWLKENIGADLIVFTFRIVNFRGENCWRSICCCRRSGALNPDRWPSTMRRWISTTDWSTTTFWPTSCTGKKPPQSSHLFSFFFFVVTLIVFLFLSDFGGIYFFWISFKREFNWLVAITDVSSLKFQTSMIRANFKTNKNSNRHDRLIALYTYHRRKRETWRRSNHVVVDCVLFCLRPADWMAMDKQTVQFKKKKKKNETNETK